MNALPLPIKEFPKDGHCYHLDWYGPVSLRAPDAQLSLIFSPIEGSESHEMGRVLYDKRREVAGIDVGLLPALKIGSIWKDGVNVGTHHCDMEYFRSVNIGPKTVQRLHAESKSGKGFLIPPYCFKLRPYGHHSECIVVKMGNDPYSLIIPVMELIRFYYCSSSTMARFLFDGRVSEDDSLIDTEESHNSRELTFIKIRKEFGDEEAPTIARIAYSPVAGREAKRIHYSLERRQPGIEVPGQPECGFPFEGRTGLTVRGKRFVSHGHQRFLVFEILECDASFPFSVLEWTRDNPGKGDGVKDESRPSAWRKKRRRCSEGPNGEGQVRSDETPSAEVLTRNVVLSNRQFAGLNRVTLRKRPKDECHYHSGNERPLLDCSHPDFGTGESGYKGSSSSPLNLIRNQAKPTHSKAMPSNFENLRRILAELVSKGDGDLNWWAVLAPDGEFARGEENEWIFPHHIDGRKRNWLLITEPTPEHRRRAMAVRVAYKLRNFSLLEVEAGVSKKSKKPKSYTLLLLHAPDNTEVPESILEEILLEFGRTPGKWLDLSGMRYFKGRPFKHTSANADQFAERIFHFIQG